MTKGTREMQEEEKNRVLSDMLYLSACAIHDFRPERSRVQRMNMENLYRMSRFHTLTNIVFEAVLSAYGGELPDAAVLRKWREERDKAVAKNLLLDAERGALCTWMEKTGIWYMPLKGSILKDFYPKSGMRQMADNDILFDADYQEQVRDWFVSRGYKIDDYGHAAHDSYLKAPVYNFEMHRMLFFDEFQPENKAWVDYYRDVNRRLLPDEGKQYGYHFSDEDFYLYMTAHARKHYLGGGTGFRTLLDFYVYLSAKGDRLDWEYIHEELPKLRLTDFERQMRTLAGKVFAVQESFTVERLSGDERRMLGYCLLSGTYGTVEQRVKNKMSELDGTEGGDSLRMKLLYMRSRMFPGRAYMDDWCRSYAPFFLRHRRLMPLALLWRLCFKGVTRARKWTGEVRCLMKLK